MLAADLAGLPRPQLINEPTAAALAYGMHESETEQTIVVLDLGGGTFDVSIVEIFEGVLEVRSSTGDTVLGGEDFTRIIAKEIARKFEYDWDGLSDEERSQLTAAADAIKKHLTRSEHAETRVSIKGKPEVFSLSRAAFEELSGELLLRMRRPIEQCLYDAKMAVQDVDRVVLVGGATRMPMIRSLAARVLRKLPESGLDPDEVVARGAAVQAALIQKNAAVGDMVMTDVAPFTLGIRSNIQTANGDIPNRFAPIIERNTILPASRIQYFSTLADNQTSISVEVYQGESPIAYENVKIGETLVKVPSNRRGKESISVRFSYDTSGLLQVDIKVLSTGEEQALLIEGNAGSLSAAEKRSRLAALEAYKVHPRDNDENQGILEKLKGLYAMLLGADRAMVTDLIARFEQALDRQDPREIARIRDEISTEITRIERGYVR